TTLTDLKKYSFIEKLVICESNLKKVSLPFYLPRLNRLVVSCSYEITTICIQSMLCLQEILINEVPLLIEFTIHPQQPQLQSISIFDVRLTHFNIHPSWSALQSIMIVNNTGTMQTLVIPEECTQLYSIRLINTNIQTLYLHPTLTAQFNLFVIGKRICVYTPDKNRVRIPLLFTNYFMVEYY
ncbi:hypothetical protein EBU71_21470, partial [bacterium]|nr:hypothetical protein [Candidatus Elulimicrobium humile]